jgi:hypothetical protein
MSGIAGSKTGWFRNSQMGNRLLEELEVMAIIQALKMVWTCSVLRVPKSLDDFLLPLGRFSKVLYLADLSLERRLYGVCDRQT